MPDAKTAVGHFHLSAFWRFSNPLFLRFPSRFPGCSTNVRASCQNRTDASLCQGWVCSNHPASLLCGQFQKTLVPIMFQATSGPGARRRLARAPSPHTCLPKRSGLVGPSLLQHVVRHGHGQWNLAHASALICACLTARLSFFDRPWLSIHHDDEDCCSSFLLVPGSPHCTFRPSRPSA